MIYALCIYIYIYIHTLNPEALLSFNRRTTYIPTSCLSAHHLDKIISKSLIMYKSIQISIDNIIYIYIYVIYLLRLVHYIHTSMSNHLHVFDKTDKVYIYIYTHYITSNTNNVLQPQSLVYP